MLANYLITKVERGDLQTGINSKEEGKAEEASDTEGTFSTLNTKSHL